MKTGGSYEEKQVTETGVARAFHVCRTEHDGSRYRGVYAASNWEAGAGNDGTIWQGQYTGAWVYNKKTGKDAKITSVKSSNSRVKVERNTWKDEDGKNQTSYSLLGKKPGKAKLTIKYKAGSKTRTIKKTVNVKKYPNQIKSLKINGKTIKTKGDRRYFYNTNGRRYTKTSAKIQMKLKKGWRISFIEGNYFNYKTGKDGRISNIRSKVTGGKTIKFPKKWTSMHIYVVMEKGNDTIDYNIDLWR